MKTTASPQVTGNFLESAEPDSNPGSSERHLAVSGDTLDHLDIGAGSIGERQRPVSGDTLDH